MKSSYRIITLVTFIVILATSYFYVPSFAKRTHENIFVEHTIFLPLIEMTSHPLAGLVYVNDQGLWIINRSGKAEYLFEQYGRISPDQKMVVYSEKDENDNYDIWLANLATNERHNLTQSPDMNDCYPEWWAAHPELIVFGTSTSASTHACPWYHGNPTTINTDGSNYHVLEAFGCTNLALSTDGVKIAYACEDQAHIYEWGKGADNFDSSIFGQTITNFSQAAWSPAAGSLAWRASGDFVENNNTAIVVFNLLSQSSQVLHPYTITVCGGAGDFHWLSWSPKGDLIAFITICDPIIINKNWIAMPNSIGTWLYVSDIDGQDAYFVGMGIDPIWSPDGTRLTYNRREFTVDDGTWVYQVEQQEQSQILPSGSQVVDWVSLDP